ncbi:PAC2 family protein [Microlunatus soli]|uniref:Proteasome assembly chaperone (PAC2) family protein n=1 Tax=Microlunatus soli TaxID=630515 RepID=A0A1H2AIM1_9ACTN|nr:PAC2 family protein [Microlunatus soli]SDT45677.1 Proteasome assembly chaperone (PAC2) family protein [Microlunatus soli]
MADETGQTGSLRDLKDAVALVAFGGWNDAGSAASHAAEHLAEVCQTRQAFSLDPDDFYDYQVNRPEVRGIGDERRIAWPTTEIRTGTLPDGRDLVIVQGLEPNFRWRQFCQLLTSSLRSAGVRRVYLLGALLADHPHTRPIPVSATSSDPDTAEELGLGPSTYEGPTGILGILGEDLAKAEIDTVSLWAAIPHYVSSPPSPKGTLALLNRLEDLLDVSLDLGDLPDLARAWERGVDELAADDSEVADYVSSLEQQRDESDLPEASGDAIAAEFERYLRRRDK